MDDYVQFTSTLKDFKTSSKIDLSSKINDIDLLNYYVSIQTPVNKQVSNLLEKVIDVKKLYDENQYLFSLKEDDFLKEINSRQFKKKINEILEDYKKDQKKHCLNLVKSIFLKNIFQKKKFFHQCIKCELL